MQQGYSHFTSGHSRVSLPARTSLPATPAYAAMSLAGMTPPSDNAGLGEDGLLPGAAVCAMPDERRIAER
jgi:hypothetical protein